VVALRGRKLTCFIKDSVVAPSRKKADLCVIKDSVVALRAEAWTEPQREILTPKSET
jgi:hypothetical protein